MIYDDSLALLSLRPSSQWTMSGNKILWANGVATNLQWNSEESVPTEQEILVEIGRLQAEFELKQYQRARANEYPSLAEQLDMLYHDRINNTDTWMEAVQAVKNKYPKS